MQLRHACFLFICLIISSNNISQISGSGSQVKKIFFICEHGTKANIGSPKMANNRHAVSRNFLQSYWTSDGLLCSSQPAFEKTHQTNTVNELPRSGRSRVTSQLEDRALYRLVRWMPFATSPLLKRQWLPNSGLSARTEEPFEISRTEVKESNYRRHIWYYQIDINDYVWHGV